MGMGTTKVKRTYSLGFKTVALIERLARLQRRDLSAIVDLSVEAYAKSHGVELSLAEKVDLVVEAETVDLVEAAAAG